MCNEGRIPIKSQCILAPVIGAEQVARQQVIKKLWDSIKAQGLQDAADKRPINADARLLALFGKPQEMMFELAGSVGRAFELSFCGKRAAIFLVAACALPACARATFDAFYAARDDLAAATAPKKSFSTAPSSIVSAPGRWNSGCHCSAAM